MVASCCVVGCYHTLRTREGIRFFRFPAVRQRYSVEYQKILTARRKAWINAIKRKNVGDKNIDNLKICSNHFVTGKPSDFRNTIHPDWIPSVSMGWKKSDRFSPQTKLKRYTRSLKRIRNRSNLISNVQSSRQTRSSKRIRNRRNLISDEQLSTECIEENINILELEVILETSDNIITFQNEDNTSTSDLVTKNCEIENSLPNDLITESAEMENTLSNDSVIHNDNGDQEPQLTADNTASEKISLLSQIQSLREESAALKVSLILQTNELEMKDKEISVLKSQNVALNDELIERNRELYELRAEANSRSWTENAFLNNDRKLKYFTGIPNLKLFNLLLKYVGTSLESLRVRKLSSFQKLLLVLMKLRHNTSFLGLGYRFNISAREASLLFQQIIIILEHTFSYVVHWPERENLRAKMPTCFREKFGNGVSVIIDCFEIAIERPGNAKAKAQTFSNYKHRHTVKYLLGITPQGFISFISEGWGGRVSDKKLTQECGILDNLLPGDIVLADRGFTINELVALQYAKLNIPEFTRGKTQLHPKAIEETRKIASVRIHVERVIALIRGKFQILKGPITVALMKTQYEGRGFVDSIVRVCCILTNLCESVIPATP